MALVSLLSALALVTNGVSCARIQMHRKASHVEVRAARELREVLQKMSGADVPYTISPGGEYLRTPYAAAEIVLVTEEHGRRLLPKRAFDRLAAMSNSDAFVVATREDRGAGRAVCIGGKTPIAVYYGVYAFLEDYPGCGFYHAGPDGTVIPKQKTVEVSDEIFDFRVPWIRYRRMSCWSKVVEPMSLDAMFAWQAKRSFQWWMDSASLHNRLSFPESALTFSQLANLPFNCGGEPFTTQAVPETLFAEHPEYFTLVNGKRVPGKYPARRCYSNPDVLRLCVELGIAFSDYGGEVAVDMTDTPGGWCECDACRAYGQDADGVWSGENYAHRFVGDVAAGILAKRPEAEVVVGAYLRWRELPTAAFRHDPRVKCVFAPHQRCYVHALNDPTAACNRHFNELYLKWLDKYPRNGIFDYYCYASTEYAPLEYVFAKDMKHYHAHGLEHFVEDTSNGSVVEMYPLNNWQLYYIYSKMVWDPDLDVEREMEKVYRRYYGRAAEPMLKYHALRRNLWETSPGHSFMGGPQHQAVCLLQPGSREKLEGWLKEAETLAKGDDMLASRVSRDRRCFEGIWVARSEKVREKLAKRGAVSVARAAKGEISVDGVLDEPVWKRARPLPALRTSKGRAMEAATDIRVAQDGANWYFAAEVSNAAPRACVTNRDGALWEDDCVEFAVATPKGDYYHFIVNARGALYDACGMGTGFDSSGDVKVVRSSEGYVVELRVPVEDMGYDAVRAEGEWSVFCARTFQTDDPQSRTVGTLFGGYAHDPHTYARAMFEREEAT